MPTSHQITCAGEDCPEWATLTALTPTPAMDHAARHRAALAADGWTDVEGRDYCPQHSPIPTA